MPSALNHDNSNKLEKQASISSVNTGGGGGGGSGQTISGQNSIAESSATNNESTSSSSHNKEKSGASSLGGAANTSSVTTALHDAAANPLKQVLITIEHKIRNLEKRKTKLESYRAIQATGRELSSDQKLAVAKYDAVMANLEFARDLSKQILQISKDAEKEQKKQARKDVVIRAHAETAKLREMLIMQNILSCLSDDQVRNDFQTGTNGAIKVEPSDMYLLEKFAFDVQARRPESPDEISFVSSAQKVAEYFSMTIDGRPKQYGDTTFENVRRIFTQIHECGYLDKVYLDSSASFSDAKDEDTSNVESTSIEGKQLDVDSLEDGLDKMNLTDSGIEPSTVTTATQYQQPVTESSPLEHQQPLELQHQLKEQQQVGATISPPTQPKGAAVANFQQPTATLHSGTSTPVHVTMFPAQQLPQTTPTAQPQLPPGGHIVSVQQQSTPLVGATPQQRQMMTSPAATVTAGQLSQGAPMPLHNAPPPPGHFPPTTVRAVEQSFFKQHQHQQYMQMRPLSEVIGGGNFYFLQDSELDSPDISFDPQTAQQNLLTTSELPQQQQQTLTASDLHKQSQEQQLQQQSAPQQQLLINNMQQQQHQQSPPLLTQQQQQSQPIQTQTFTNQSFPPIPPPQVQPQAAVSIVNASVANNSNVNPMFTQKHQLFSPVAGLQQQQQHLLQPQQTQDIVAGVTSNINNQQQLLLNEQQQPAMVFMGRMTAPQVGLPPQQQPLQSLSSQQQQQQNDVAVVGNVIGYAIDNPSVSAFTYEQQMQHQIAAAAAALKSANSIKSSLNSSADKHNDISKAHTEDSFGSDALANEWGDVVNLKNATSRTTNTTPAGTAVAALASVLKTAAGGVMETTNKWSTEMNALGTPPTPNSGGGGSSTTQSRKNEWTTSSNRDSGGYGDVVSSQSVNNSTSHESNHWNSNQTQDAGGYGRSGGGGNSRMGSSSYQRRNDDRRDRDDRRDDRGRPGGGGGGNSNNYRGRSSNYGNSSAQQNGGASGGGRSGGGGGGSGMYFRNNESSTSGGSSYYQNGVYGGNKDSGSRYEYRPRGGPGGGGGNSSSRGNVPPPRSLGRSSGSGNSANTTPFMTARQSNRMPMGLENKN